ncbi:MAG: hypothetical protein ACODUE_09155 [Synechococcus sp.]
MARNPKARIECLILEILDINTNVADLSCNPIKTLHDNITSYLDYEGFEYFVELGFTARSLRKVLMNCSGTQVIFLLEGDRIGAVGLYAHTKTSEFAIARPADHQGLRPVERHMSQLLSEYQGIISIQSVFFANPNCILANRLCLLDELQLIEPSKWLGEFFHEGIRELCLRCLLQPKVTLTYRRDIAVASSPASLLCSETTCAEMNMETIRGYLYADSLRIPTDNKIILDFIVDWSLHCYFQAATSHEGNSGQSFDPRYPLTHLGLDGMSDIPSNSIVPFFNYTSSVHYAFWNLEKAKNIRLDHLAKCFSETREQPAAPIASIVTSLFRESIRIVGFLRNTLQFDSFLAKAELIAVLPEKDISQSYILDFYGLYVNRLSSIQLDEDPGIYKCWETGIKAARGIYVSNANPDDRRCPSHLMRLVDLLDKHQAVIASTAISVIYNESDLKSVVLGDSSVSINPEVNSDTWYLGSMHREELKTIQDFFLYNEAGDIIQCYNFLHCMPVWRKSLHVKYGYFNESRYGTYADFALWIKLAKQGESIVHLNEPLGLYVARDDSHNRINADPSKWLQIIADFKIDAIVNSISDHVQVSSKNTPGADLPEKVGYGDVNFGDQLRQNYGNHRSGWTWAISLLNQFHKPTSELDCNLFIEKKFVWGCDDGDAYGVNPSSYNRPWIGFIHVPPLVPRWFQYEQSNDQVFRSRLFKESVMHCIGLATLTDYHRQSLVEKYNPPFPIHVIYHPAEAVSEESKFNLDIFFSQQVKTVVQVGWWLRKLSAIRYIETPPDFEKVLLGSSNWSKSIITYCERRYFDLAELPNCTNIDFLENDDYDALLKRSIVFIDFYDTSANNAIIECIARGTPCLVPRHPAILEYLGLSYPLYYDRYQDIPKLLEESSRIRDAQAIMQGNYCQSVISPSRFVASFSEFLRSLQP